MKRIIAVLLAFTATTAIADEALQELKAAFDGRPSATEFDLKATTATDGWVMEFYNSGLKHYFRTIEPAEVQAIQSGGAGPGWSQTTDDFAAWTVAGKPFDALPVCRFYAAGPNSHFFTIDPNECEQVKKDPGWKYEGIAYYAKAISSARDCNRIDTTPVYRAYNGRFAQNDSNHRFTSSTSNYQSMISQGWIGEGIVMCVPITPTDVQRTAWLIGGTWIIGPYMYGNTAYTDTLRYTSTFTASSGAIYAQGTSGHNNSLTIGNYTTTLNQWAMLAPYSNVSSTPADYYVVNISGNTMAGCYYFLATASSVPGSCTPIIGRR